MKRPTVVLAFAVMMLAAPSAVAQESTHRAKQHADKPKAPKQLPPTDGCVQWRDLDGNGRSAIVQVMGQRIVEVHGSVLTFGEENCLELYEVPSTQAHIDAMCNGRKKPLLLRDLLGEIALTLARGCRVLNKISQHY
ncbi:MAG TPA: hypothetical protein VKM54_04225 [Myxococcota bacterium]|nr:hypothetical protein [Myxococcota bacterium]